MKSILLLAAVYSLIIHQWHKEKKSKEPATTVVKIKPDPSRNKMPTGAELNAFYTLLKIYE